MIDLEAHKTKRIKMRKIKFRAFCKFDNTMVLPMTIQKMIFQKVNEFDLCSLYKDFIFMQYIGLKDKNGVEIYEGDIVKAYKQILEVRWNEDFVCFELYKRYENIAFVLDCDVEVVGNIYENPELLEDKQ